MSKFHSFLDRILGTAEEINGANRCPTYLYRWTLLRMRSRQYFHREWKVYIHKFVGDDWSLDLHDHPKRFTSVGLWGSYLEETPTGLRKFNAPWLRSFPPDHRHRITTPWGTCWTLVIVGPTVRHWGFWHDGKFIEWKDYVHSETADKMKACP